MVIIMNVLILEEIKGQLYCSYLHNMISEEQLKIFLERLYKYFNENLEFSYVQIIKYVFGGDEDEANASDT